MPLYYAFMGHQGWVNRERHNLTSHILKQIDVFKGSIEIFIGGRELHRRHGRKVIPHLSLAKVAARTSSVKLADGDVHRAVAALCSDMAHVKPCLKAFWEL